jgi:hypothetical protein
VVASGFGCRAAEFGLLEVVASVGLVWGVVQLGGSVLPCVLVPVFKSSTKDLSFLIFEIMIQSKSQSYGARKN